MKVLVLVLFALQLLLLAVQIYCAIRVRNLDKSCKWDLSIKYENAVWILMCVIVCLSVIIPVLSSKC